MLSSDTANGLIDVKFCETISRISSLVSVQTNVALFRSAQEPSLLEKFLPFV